MFINHPLPYNFDRLAGAELIFMDYVILGSMIAALIGVAVAAWMEHRRDVPGRMIKDLFDK